MPRPRPVSRIRPGPGRWILNAFEVNDPPRKMTRTPGTTKKISLLRILLLIHHQVGPNPLWHSSKRTKTVVLTKEDPNDRAKTKILLPLASMLLLSRRTRTRIRTRRTSPILNGTLVSKKPITPASALRKSQKTSVGLDNFHVGD